MRAAYEEFLLRIKDANKVKIFGAGKFAKTLYYLCERNGVEVEFFIVSKADTQDSELFGKPVIALDKVNDGELCNIIVGFEKKLLTFEIMSCLLEKGAKNTIMVNQNIINDIYCNFIIDQPDLNAVCEQLKKEENIIIYANNYIGEMAREYFENKNILVNAICIDNPKILKNEAQTVISGSDLEGCDKSAVIVLVMNSIWTQRSYITKLRNMGFERLILISDEIKNELELEYRRVLWEEDNAYFKIVETSNVEIYHYVVEKEYGDKLYRFRIPDKELFNRADSIKEAIRGNRFIEKFESQYPNSSYISYKTDELDSVNETGVNLEVYMAKFHKDKDIIHQKMPKWVIPIQVGKALTDIKIADVCDDNGDNISLKNTDYSEGTALYWMWKNTKGQDYIGLFHYRRQITMDNESIKKILQQDITLTLPTYMHEGIKAFFCNTFILRHDWELMMKSIREYDGTYYETALCYEKSHFYFPCNIFIMKRTLFDEICTFIFGVLDKVEAYYKGIDLIRQDRYMGFLVENLLSIYVMHNVDKLKIAYTDMKYQRPINSDK